MSENLRNYTKAVYGFDAIARRVPEGAWENQSPCAEWKAVDVLGHVVGGSMMVRGFVGGPGPATGAHPSTRDLAGARPFEAWAAQRDGVLEALDHPHALATVAETPFGSMPIDNFLGIFATDVFTHAWDLARAARIEHCLDEALAAKLFEAVKPMDAMIRRPGIFDAKKDAPAGAAVIEQMMAFLGRKV